ncbi:MAG: glycoside hydrolase family 44 protein [Tahibacter sp.]
MRGALLCLLSIVGVAQAQTVPPVNLYIDSLNASFQNWSWSTDYSLNNVTPAHSGSPSIRFVPKSWEGLLFADVANTYDVAQYESLTFWIHGGSGNGQVLHVSILSGGVALAELDVASNTAGGIVAATWKKTTIPFTAANGLTSGGFNRLQIQDFTGGSQSTVYIDDIVFNPRTTPLPSGNQSVNVNLSGSRHSVSPLIYGVSYGSTSTLANVHYPVRRWGGNSTTRYNWQVDVHSTAGDYYWQNIPDSPSGTATPPVNNNADRFIDEVRAAGGEALISIPTIGKVPLPDRTNKHWGFSVAKYGPQLRNECSEPGSASYCTADSGNGECDPAINTGLDSQGHRYCVAYGNQGHFHIVNNDPADTSVNQPATFWMPWIAHFQSRYGSAAAGGVRLFSLDNEPMLWDSTHRDVHPVAPTYDEVWTKGRDLAVQIKTQEPAAKTFGPVTWGYPDLFTSAADAASCNCLSGSDRAAHAGKAYIQWYLEQVCAYEQQTGIRLVDYLDLHYYPQGDGIVDFNGYNIGYSESAAVAAKRLRSLRELYDPSYVSESWMSDLGDADGNHYSKPGLLPRVKAWMATACPGHPLKISISEYNWGPDQGASGALAQAEALAIFAREGVDAAMRWVAPEAGSYAEDAFKLFLNYDGSFSRVDGDSVATSSSDSEILGAYTIYREGQHVYVLLFNKSTSPQNVAIGVSSTLAGAWQAWRFDGSHHLGAAGNGTISGSTLTLNSLPARSSTLLVLPAPVGSDLIFRAGFE